MHIYIILQTEYSNSYLIDIESIQAFVFKMKFQL